MTTTHRPGASPSARRRSSGFSARRRRLRPGDAGRHAAGPAVRVLGTEIRFRAVTTTLIVAVYALGTVVSLLFFASMSDRLGRRPMLMAALGAAVLSTVLFLLAGDVAMLLVARLVFGLAAGVFTATATATLAELADAAGRYGRDRRQRRWPGCGRSARRCPGSDDSRPYPRGGLDLIPVALAPAIAAIAAIAAIVVTPETAADRHRPDVWIRPLVRAHGCTAQREFLGAAIAAFAVAGCFPGRKPGTLGGW